ncbi:MAG: type II toxin-antitoxin system VapC family toxin [Candidatus Acidiferrales bacterium]
MSDFILDASVAGQWFLEDELDRAYSPKGLSGWGERRALVPLLCLYEALVLASRRKRIPVEQVERIVRDFRRLPIEVAHQSALEVLDLPRLALTPGLTCYDAAYLAVAVNARLPIASVDSALKAAARTANVGLHSVDEQARCVTTMQK